MEKDGTQRVNVKLSPEVYDFFKKRSKKTGVPMSALMFLILEEYYHERKDSL